MELIHKSISLIIRALATIAALQWKEVLLHIMPDMKTDSLTSKIILSLVLTLIAILVDRKYKEMSSEKR